MKQTSEAEGINYFEELTRRCHREQIEFAAPEADLMPIMLNGKEIGIATLGGGMRVRKESIEDPEANDLYHRVGAIASEVHEYTELMKEAPLLKASSLSDPYRVLADFNGFVLGGMQSKQGVQFTTWEWTYNKSGLTLGHYCGNDYAAAKKDFALRTGLVQEEKQFTHDQLIDIYQCCADTLTHNYTLTYEQEKRIEDIQSKIADMVPNYVERFKQAQEQDASSQQMQQTM
ncbi:MAG: hypothetical protein PHE09_11820 [Oscillospiraceae bacterium]|nr:hypothetical protein [Oscillospiraceae bacterium]